MKRAVSQLHQKYLCHGHWRTYFSLKEIVLPLGIVGFIAYLTTFALYTLFSESPIICLIGT